MGDIWPYSKVAYCTARSFLMAYPDIYAFIKRALRKAGVRRQVGVQNMTTRVDGIAADM